MKRTLKDRLMGVVLGILIGATLVTTAAATTGKIQKMLDYTDIKITLDGEEIIPKDANGKYVEPFAIEGTTYLPVRAISNALGLEVGWDQATKTVILESPHQYDDGKVTIPATCEHSGTITYTCIDCGKTKTEYIPMLEHEPNSNYVCKMCGTACYVDLYLTDEEISEAEKIAYISEREIDNLTDENRFRLMFSLLDENEDFLKVPVLVEIQITNSNNEIVYNAVRTVYTEDYSSWKNSYGKHWTAAAVYIDYDDILPGTTDDGSITFTVHNDYAYFDPTTLTISSGLPLAQSTVLLPQIPATISSYNYDGSIESSVKITNITYTIENDDLYIYFTGEKTYDEEGSKYSRSINVGWKLYDSEGYIIDSGTFYSKQLAVGEKFRNEKEYAFDVIEPGKTYQLEILDVD